MKISSLLLLSFFLAFPFILKAQSCYKAAWVKDFGGNSEYNSIIDGDRRPDGSFVVAGTFGNAPLELGNITLQNTYAYNFYLAVHDSSGNISAATVIGSGGTITKIDAGPDGSVCVTGYWSGSIQIGPQVLPEASRKRVFVAKFNADLEFQWLRQSDWMSADCYSYDVTIDLQNNVYICGNFEDNAFKIGDVVVDNSGGWNMWSREGFFVKFNSEGVTQYARSFGGSNDETARTITADSLGNIFICGSTAKTNGWVKFGEHVGLPGSVASNSAFIARYDGATGVCQWARMLGGFSNYDWIFPYDACLGDNNSLIVSGSITGTVSLPPHSYYAYDQNCFVARFSNNGDNEWLQQTGGQGTSEYGYYCFYNKGRVAVSGRLFSNRTYCADFPLYSTNNTSFYAFNALFEGNGRLVWARGNASTYSSDFYPGTVLIDDSGNELYWGVYKGSQTWYPVTLNNSASYGKTFLARFIPFSPAPAFTVSAGEDKTTTCSTYVQLQASTVPSNIPFGWWPNLGFSANGSKTPSVNPGQPAIYVFYATYQGCVNSDTVQVMVSDYNDLTIDAGADVGFCAGDSVQLSVNSNQSGLTYSWSPVKYISSTNVQNPWVKPVLPANYVVTATIGGCVAIDTVYVNQHSKPYIYLPKQDQYYGNWWRYHLCEGNPADIDLGDPANTYTVSPLSLTSSTSNNLVTLHGNYPGDNLFVEAVSPDGCYQRDSVTIVIHNNQSGPQILGSVPNRSACQDDSLQITVWLTNDNYYSFQYSWYSGWQVDSMNGQGWKDISIWDKHYDIFPYSVGYPTSTYYICLRIPKVNTDMDGFRYRCYVRDYCSPTTYSNAGKLTIGPKITQQPPALKTLCQGNSDSISVNSSSTGTQFHWEILQNGQWTAVVPQPGVMMPNGRYLSFYQVQPVMDSIWVRCGLNGCNPSGTLNYTDSCLIRVVPQPIVLSQTGYDTICPGQPDSLYVQPNSSLFSFNWYANGVALTSNNSQITGFNTPKLRFTPVYSVQNNIDYTLRMRHSQCGFSVFSDTTGFRVIDVPAVSWPGNMILSCVNAAPIVLTGATPTGGTYSGPGVSGGVFYPALAGAGSHIVTYTVNSSVPGCTASTANSFWVQEPPIVTWPGGNLGFCSGSASYHLSGGSPNFGTYGGPGVSGQWFQPANAGTGPITVYYTYLNPSTGCSDTAFRIFTVTPDPVATWPGGQVNMCLDDPADSLSGALPAGGTYAGPGVIAGMLYPLAAGPGLHSITYTYIDPVNNCESGTSRDYYIDECTGIDRVSEGAVRISTDGKILTVEFPVATNKSINLYIYTISGQLQYYNILPPGTLSTTLLLPASISGLQLLRLSGEEYSGNYKIIHIE